MLDNNTNKVVWVGVAIGVVTLVSAGALLLFPQITDNFKPMIRQSMLVTQATPNALFFSPEKDLTYADNYFSSWKAYYFFLTKKSLEVKPNTYVYYGLDVKVDKDSVLFVDISNVLPGVVGNDHDTFDKRHIKIESDDGNVLYDGPDKGPGLPNPPLLKANAVYHVQIYYQNDSDQTFTDSPGTSYNSGTGLALRPAIGAKPGNDLHVSVSNYKINMVHF